MELWLTHKTAPERLSQVLYIEMTNVTFYCHRNIKSDLKTVLTYFHLNGNFNYSIFSVGTILKLT